ncbi:MAG: D-alanyl-D-alanine carboxypeptidase [Butyrivibrio sp.]|nr:D-alanyl-D-alanine carboxypeptidase [Acetatifactor muris]MCM1561618.1 D-alanyl-D-alanine carboxypeptidase [Butyrivibrio sp.]
MTHIKIFRIKKNKKQYTALFTALACACSLFLLPGMTARADTLSIDERIEQNRALPVQSNTVPNWPAGPVVSAEAAILMEVDTGTILYSKNIHQREYPASTTKLLTTLIATEQCSLDEIVTFSYDAVFDTPRDSNHIAMDVGQQLTMEQCLNAILIRSANEVSFAVAEHISGTTDWSVFAEMMNGRAAELGCLNSHFVNPNGLPDENHYTTAYDLAMIGRAFFANEMLCKITLTRRLEIPASDTIPEAKVENSSMQIIPGGAYAYENLVGCKTGYTNAARYCLVSCAEKDGMRLICVVLQDEFPFQYEDTIALFNYGFSNFDKVNVSQTETKYNVDGSSIFYGGNDIFGNSKPLLTLNKDDYIVLPRTAVFDDTDSAITYETDNENQAAVISYTYHGVDIGTVRVDFVREENDTYIFNEPPADSQDAGEEEASGKSVIFINIVRVLTVLAGIAAAFFIVCLVRAILKNYQFSFGGGRRIGRRNKNTKKRKRPNRFRDYDF